MSTTACDACGECVHSEFVYVTEKGTFCNEDCAKSAEQGIAVQLPLFEGWDEGSSLFEEKYNPIHKPQIPFRERNL